MSSSSSSLQHAKRSKRKAKQSMSPSDFAKALYDLTDCQLAVAALPTGAKTELVTFNVTPPTYSEASEHQNNIEQVGYDVMLSNFTTDEQTDIVRVVRNFLCYY